MASSGKKQPCPYCPSSDAFVVYDDGNKQCFSCGTHEFPDGAVGKEKGDKWEIERTKEAEINNDLLIGEFAALTKRGIREETCKLFNYKVGHFNGQPVQIANYYRNNKVVAQKLRFPTKPDGKKDMLTLGDFKSVGLFGDHLWGNGKRITITEGELDAMSVSQCQGNKWPVVSVKNGAQGALKNIKENISYFNNFEQIVLMFDMDEEGQSAALECASQLPLGKVSIAALPSPFKDANEMLLAGKAEELINCIWRAKPFIPDGIADKEELWSEFLVPQAKSCYEYPFPLLNEMTYGCRPNQVVMICGGTGLGKSTLARHIGLSLMLQNQKVGFCTLEESRVETLEYLCGQHIGVNLRNNEDAKKSQEALEFKKTLYKLAEFYDTPGRCTPSELSEKIEFMAIALDCKWIIVDHISMIAGRDRQTSLNEMIDDHMTNLRAIAKRFNLGIFVVSHLRKQDKDSKSFEEGKRVTLGDLKGAQALMGIPNLVIAFEGMMEDKSGKRTVRILKNRYRGARYTGTADILTYDDNTGSLHVIDNLQQIEPEM